MILTDLKASDCIYISGFVVCVCARVYVPARASACMRACVRVIRPLLILGLYL